MNKNSNSVSNSKTLIQKIISKAIETRFIIWLSNTRLAAFFIRLIVSRIAKRKKEADDNIELRTFSSQKETGDELDHELMKIATDIVHELGYVAAMVASYEQGDVLPARSFYINPEIASRETIEEWEKEIAKYTSTPVSITDPSIARVFRYEKKHKENLSIRAIEAEKPLMTDEIYDLFRPIAPEASRHLVNTVQKTLGINKLIAVPFFVNVQNEGKLFREVVGNLFVATKEETFDPKEIKILSTLAQQAAMTIEGINKRRRDILVRKLVLTMQANLSDETVILKRIAESLVEEFGYPGAMVAPYEKNDVLPVRAFSVNRSIASFEEIEIWEEEVSKISSRTISITNPDIARVNRYKNEDKENLSIRAIEEEKPLVTDEIYDLFRPIAPEASRELINEIQRKIGIQKLVAVPFFLEKEENGVVTKEVLGNLFTATRSRSFNQGEMELFKILGEQAAAGIRNARILRYANERRIAAQNFAKMAFAATAYLHELRNHIGAFYTHLQLIQSIVANENINEEIKIKLDGEKIPKIEERLNKNHEILDRMKKVRIILDNLREPWKTEQDKIININKCLTRAIAKALPGSTDSNSKNNEQRYSIGGIDDIIVMQDFSEGMPDIKISDDMLTEAYRIIIKNAIDALLKVQIKEKRLWILSKHEGNIIKVVIRDNGPGISSENLEKIFEYGWSTSEVGMGFGLYWAKDFIEGAGGTITVDSEQNIGTTFTLKIPAVEKIESVLISNATVKK